MVVAMQDRNHTTEIDDYQPKQFNYGVNTSFALLDSEFGFSPAFGEQVIGSTIGFNPMSFEQTISDDAGAEAASSCDTEAAVQSDIRSVNWISDTEDMEYSEEAEVLFEVDEPTLIEYQILNQETVSDNYKNGSSCEVFHSNNHDYIVTGSAYSVNLGGGDVPESYLAATYLLDELNNYDQVMVKPGFLAKAEPQHEDFELVPSIPMEVESTDEIEEQNDLAVTDPEPDPEIYALDFDDVEESTELSYNESESEDDLMESDSFQEPDPNQEFYTGMLNIIKKFMIQYKSEKNNTWYQDFLTRTAKYSGVYCMPVPLSVIKSIEEHIAEDINANGFNQIRINMIENFFRQFRILVFSEYHSNDYFEKSNDPDVTIINYRFQLDSVAPSSEREELVMSIVKIIKDNASIALQSLTKLYSDTTSQYYTQINKITNKPKQQQLKFSTQIINTMLFEQLNIIDQNIIPTIDQLQVGIVIEPHTGMQRRTYSSTANGVSNLVKFENKNFVVNFVLISLQAGFGINNMFELDKLKPDSEYYLQAKQVFATMPLINDFFTAVRKDRGIKHTDNSEFSTVDLSSFDLNKLYVLLRQYLMMEDDSKVKVLIMRSKIRISKKKSSQDSLSVKNKRKKDSNQRLKRINIDQGIFRSSHPSRLTADENGVLEDFSSSAESNRDTLTGSDISIESAQDESLAVFGRLNDLTFLKKRNQDLTPSRKLQSLKTVNNKLAELINNTSDEIGLYHYQEHALTRIVKHMSNIILADDMGLGKTITTIAAIKLMLQLNQYFDSHNFRPIIIVAQKNIISHWMEKLAKYNLDESYILNLDNVKGNYIALKPIILTPPTKLKNKLTHFKDNQIKEVCGFLPDILVPMIEKHFNKKIYAEIFNIWSNHPQLKQLFTQYKYEGEKATCIKRWPFDQEWELLKSSLKDSSINTNSRILKSKVLKRLIASDLIRTHLIRSKIIDRYGAFMKITKPIDLESLFLKYAEIAEVISLESINDKLNSRRNKFNLSGFIVDEVHTLLSEQGTLNSKVYRSIIRSLRSIKGKSRPVLNLYLTGTPFENCVSEFACLLNLVAPDVYPDVKTFQRSYNALVNDLDKYIINVARESTPANYEILKSGLHFILIEIKAYIDKYMDILIRRERDMVQIAGSGTEQTISAIPKLTKLSHEYELSSEFIEYVAQNSEAVLGSCRVNKQTTLASIYAIETMLQPSKKNNSFFTIKSDLERLANHPLQSYFNNTDKETESYHDVLVPRVKRLLVEEYDYDLQSVLKHKGKLKTIIELATDIIRKENTPELPNKIIIPCRRLAFMAMLQVILENILNQEIYVYHGQLSSEQRANVLAKFNGSNEQEIIIISDAGSVGMELPTANHMIMTWSQWNQSTYNQIYARMQRIGNKHAEVFLHMIENENNPLDMKIKFTAEEKNREFDFYVNGKVTAEDFLRLRVSKIMHANYKDRKLLAKLNSDIFSKNLTIIAKQVENIIQDIELAPETTSTTVELEGVEDIPAATSEVSVAPEIAISSALRINLANKRKADVIDLEETQESKRVCLEAYYTVSDISATNNESSDIEQYLPSDTDSECEQYRSFNSRFIRRKTVIYSSEEEDDDEQKNFSPR